MFESNNIFGTNISGSAVGKAYGTVSNLNGGSARNQALEKAMSVVRELHTGGMASLQRDITDTETAVSTIEIFSGTIETITEKLAKILELAQKALEPYHPHEQIEQMQQQFRNFSKEINQVGDSTEYKYKRLFSGSGKSLLINAGDGSNIDITAKEFFLDAQDMNIAKEPKNGFSMIKKAIKSFSEYKADLERKVTHLIDIKTDVESEIQETLDTNVQNFQPEFALPMARFTATMISQREQPSLDIQANLSANQILRLLKTG